MLLYKRNIKSIEMKQYGGCLKTVLRERLLWQVHFLSGTLIKVMKIARILIVPNLVYYNIFQDFSFLMWAVIICRILPTWCRDEHEEMYNDRDNCSLLNEFKVLKQVSWKKTIIIGRKCFRVVCNTTESERVSYNISLLTSQKIEDCC